MDGALPNVSLALRLTREGLEEAARGGDLAAAQRYLRIWECLVVAPAVVEVAAPEVSDSTPTLAPLEATIMPEAASTPAIEPDAVLATAEPEPEPEPEATPEPVLADAAPEPCDVTPTEASAAAPEPIATLAPPPTAEPQAPAPPPVRERLKDLCDAIRSFEAEEGKNAVVRCAEAKALLCRAMALWEAAEAANLRYILSQETEILLGFLRKMGSSDFFDRNDYHEFPAWDWEELGEAYGLVADAEGLTALLKQGEADPDEVRFGVTHAAAGQAMAARWFILRSLRMDAAVARLRDDLQTLQGDRFYIPWWKMEGPDAADPAKILESAKGIGTARDKIAAAIAARQKRSETSRRTNEALGRLRELMESPGDGDAFEAKLVASVELALGDGIPPSNRQLRLLLAGYRHVVERVGHSQGPKLCEYLDKDALASLAKHEVVAEPPAVADESELRRWTEELAPLMRGKTLLLIGGNKGQLHRKNDYKEHFGLADVLWPDLEESDKPTIARPQLDKADVVAYIVRFSRHSYKSLLDEAKRMGKVTVTLPRGLGLNTVVRDMHEQLVRARQNGATPTGTNGH